MTVYGHLEGNLLVSNAGNFRITRELDIKGDAYFEIKYYCDFLGLPYYVVCNVL